MRIAVIGGKLQGVEIAYLAQESGHQVLLIDKDKNAPASGFSDQYIQANVFDEAELEKSLLKCDLVFPAFENLEGLTRLNRFCRQRNIPFVFDLEAYRVSCSKLASDQLFKKLQLPQPQLWPNCSFPIVAKPSDGSGSEGVQVIKSQQEIQDFYPNQFPPPDCVVQQYIEGPSYSIEVIGQPGCYQTFQITELGMDQDYDCKRVTAPVNLPDPLEKQFSKMGCQLAEAIQLKGIMDIEVILHEDQLKLLEIDARFPSQTPITVFESSGQNMVKILIDLFTNKKKISPPEFKDHNSVIFEHISVSHKNIKIEGEHIMAEKGPLHLDKDFFGADKAITNYEIGKQDWVATLILIDENEKQVKMKSKAVLANIKNQFGINRIIDLDPTKR